MCNIDADIYRLIPVAEYTESGFVFLLLGLGDNYYTEYN